MGSDDKQAAAFASHDELQAAHGEPLVYGLRMHLDYLHEHHLSFIAMSPFCVLTSVDRNGYPTASPKGDPPGFVKAIDRHTLLLPDRPGNNQLQTLHNVMDAPKVGLIFFVPGIDESLRIHGSARLTTEPERLALLEVKGRLPKTALLVTVERAYIHCGKALKRSKLWDPATRVPRDCYPSIACIMVDQTGPVPGKSLAELDELAETLYRTALY